MQRYYECILSLVGTTEPECMHTQEVYQRVNGETTQPGHDQDIPETQTPRPVQNQRQIGTTKHGPVAGHKEANYLEIPDVEHGKRQGTYLFAAIAATTEMQ